MLTDGQKLNAIQLIRNVNAWHMDADEGDRHLASQGYALEAIDAVLNDDTDNGILRQFMEAEIPTSEPEVREPESVSPIGDQVDPDTGRGSWDDWS